MNAVEEQLLPAARIAAIAGEAFTIALASRVAEGYVWTFSASDRGLRAASASGSSSPGQDTILSLIADQPGIYRATASLKAADGSGMPRASSRPIETLVFEIEVSR
jgi:hypothetical protein